MRWLGVLVLAFTGCGRLGFDAISVGDAGPATDGISDAGCVFGPFGAPVALAELDSAQDDGGGWLSDDRLEVVFSTNRAGSFDVYRAVRVSAQVPFDPPQPIPVAATGFVEDAPFVTADGLTLWFNLDTGAGVDIVRSARASIDAPFQLPVVVNELSSSSVDEGVNLSLDELAVVFDSDRLANCRHLYRATRASAAIPFGAPVELTDLAVAGMNESMPTLASDGTIYFTSDALTITKRVVAMARPVPPPGTYGPATMFAEVSDGSSSDIDPFLTRDGLTMLFSSNRSGNNGFELYMTQRACL